MSEKNVVLLRQRQAFLILFTQQLILHSRNKMDELENLIQTESGLPPKVQPPPSPQVQQNPEEKNLQAKKEDVSAMITSEKEPMMKSIMSQGPGTIGGRDKTPSIVKPVHIKTPRMEVPSIPQGQPMRVLRIPEPRLPPEFAHLRPTPVQREIDLGKLNPFIYDPQVRIIECLGPDKPIFVTGTMGRKPTSLILSNEETEDIIQRFSSASKIPTSNGIYKVVVGRLIFSAIISDVVPSRFMIRKMQTATPVANPYQTANPNYTLFFGQRR